MTSGAVPQLASVPFGAGAVVPALFRAEPAELAVVLFRVLVPAVLFRVLVPAVLFRVLVPAVLFRALVVVVLADSAVVCLAAVVRGALVADAG
jgi:hypothetical protein